jgi:hypothetical protein
VLADFWTAVLGWVITEHDEYGNITIKPSPDADHGAPAQGSNR